ncbi:MAG: sulfatase-like hydrolase/transferase, partial [Rhodospirillales bacterium]
MTKLLCCRGAGSRVCDRVRNKEGSRMVSPKNLIYFQSDNHNRDFLGSYGHPAVLTPALDRLAARGTRFANTYCVSAHCCPARAGIATGRYP